MQRSVTAWRPREDRTGSVTAIIHRRKNSPVGTYCSQPTAVSPPLACTKVYRNYLCQVYREELPGGHVSQGQQYDREKKGHNSYHNLDTITKTTNKWCNSAFPLTLRRRDGGTEDAAINKRFRKLRQL